MAAANGFDDADMAARITRQPRMRRRVDIFRAYAVADRKARG